MKKLIETTQEFHIVCDNPKCGFKIKNDDKNIENDNISEYLNVECPECGDNLLTEEDYINYLRVSKTIKWLNKWFSWLTIFTSKKNYTNATIGTHKGINIR